MPPAPSPVSEAPAAPTLAVVLKGYPRLSETFIAQELLALERRGFALRLYSLRRPTDHDTHPIHDEIAAPVLYLPEYAHREPLRVARALARAATRRRFPMLVLAVARDARRDPTRNRVRRALQALVLAAEIDPQARLIYAHFLHTPASVARYAAILTGTPFAVSAHAKDIWTLPEWEKREKLAEAAFVTTCARANHHHLDRLAPGRSALVHHGLDFARFPSPPSRQPTTIAEVLTVARAVPKKGLDGLLRALAALDPAIAWRWTHIGGGPELGALSRLADELGLAPRIRWRGAQPQTAVLDAYRMADLFVLPSRIADDGDRDGLPNVLMEAQSQAVCCVSTDAAGAVELIVDGETGVIVPQNDDAALTAALGRLIADPDLRMRLGAAGAARVRALFDHNLGVDRIAASLRGAMETAA